MKKWINLKINLKQQSSVLSKVHYFHEEEVKKNREYLQIIVETSIFTAVQNIPQRINAELKLLHCHHSHWKELEKTLKMLFLIFFPR